MIAIDFDKNQSYFPLSTFILSQIFSAGTNYRTDSRMFSSRRSTFTVERNAENEVENTRNHGCLRFDFHAIENAFDCEFVELPEDINNGEDFHKWLMETKFE